uniref:Uncharacterized protein n=1 Tax=Ciona savignyi TaxID=51511 RepID=H2YWE6_CIOSA
TISSWVELYKCPLCTICTYTVGDKSDWTWQIDRYRVHCSYYSTSGGGGVKSTKRFEKEILLNHRVKRSTCCELCSRGRQPPWTWLGAGRLDRSGCGHSAVNLPVMVLVHQVVACTERH